jgi:hypothetical protein
MLMSVREKDPQMGCPAFPFIDQGKDLGYKRERKTKERALGLRCTSPLWVGLAGPVDDNESVCMLQTCSSPALQAGTIVLVMMLLSVTGAIGRCHRLDAVPGSALTMRHGQ